jgi:hypothetical protein
MRPRPIYNGGPSVARVRAQHEAHLARVRNRNAIRPEMPRPREPRLADEHDGHPPDADWSATTNPFRLLPRPEET